MKLESPSMRRKTQKYLYDIQKALNTLRQFIENKTFEDYQKDAMLKSATERQFGIIGEAMAQLARIKPEITSKISCYQRIIAFRNILIHGYAEINDLIVWEIIQNNLPTLNQEIKTLNK